MSNSPSQPNDPRRSNSPDNRSPVAQAAEWSSRIMTVSLEMVLPGLAGYWLDGKHGTKVLFMLIGFTLGGIAAVMHLIHLTRKTDQVVTKKNPTDHNERKP